jgi:SOS-response transcriptional repressor LexA
MLGMSSLSERIKELAADLPRGWQAELARYCKVKPPSVAGWVSGDTKTLDGENLLNVAAFFKANPKWIATGKGRKYPDSSTYSSGSAAPEQGNISPQKIAIGGRVPLISLVAAGTWRESVDNLVPGTAEEWVTTTVAVKQHTYALRVEGDSMEPRFPHGAILIVEPEEEARNGSFVIVRQNGSEATFKQLVYDGGQAYLKPLNPRYPIMQMRPDAVICGVVKQMVMDV